MPDWVHRTTKNLLKSVAPADLPKSQANYIESPDLSAVEGEPSIYWNVVGDTVSLMSQAERDAVDAQALTDNRDSEAARMDDAGSLLHALMLVMLEELNSVREQTGLTPRTLQQVKVSVRDKLGN